MVVFEGFSCKLLNNKSHLDQHARRIVVHIEQTSEPIESFGTFHTCGISPILLVAFCFILNEDFLNVIFKQ